MQISAILNSTFERLQSRLAPNLIRSYSQYGEDAVIQSLFRLSRSGTYVDIGAHHPVRGSNTYGLYRRGWRGYTIDPNPDFAPLFRRHRPADTHIVAGIADSDSILTYHRFEQSVLNTFDVERAKMLISSGQILLKKEPIECLPLVKAIPAIDDSQIDLLNVDCEGMDLDVIKSFNLVKRRVIAVVVEDIEKLRSLRRGEGASEIEGDMRKSGYRLISQIAFSSLYIAEDWRQLVKRSNAFRLEWMQQGPLP